MPQSHKIKTSGITNHKQPTRPQATANSFLLQHFLHTSLSLASEGKASQFGTTRLESIFAQKNLKILICLSLPFNNATTNSHKGWVTIYLISQMRKLRYRVKWFSQGHMADKKWIKICGQDFSQSWPLKPLSLWVFFNMVESSSLQLLQSSTFLSPQNFLCLSKKQPTKRILLCLLPGKIPDVVPASTSVQIISVLPW